MFVIAYTDEAGAIKTVQVASQRRRKDLFADFFLLPTQIAQSRFLERMEKIKSIRQIDVVKRSRLLNRLAIIFCYDFYIFIYLANLGYLRAPRRRRTPCLRFCR